MKKSATVDPVGSAEEAISQKTATAGKSLFDHEPIRTWVTALAERKAKVGQMLSWDEIRGILAESSREVVEAGGRVSIKVGEKTRAPKAAEIEALRRFVEKPPRKRALQDYLENHHPELWARVKRAANGR